MKCFENTDGRERGHDSLGHADHDGQTGQSQADQEDHQEEEVGAGRPERTGGGAAVVDQGHLAGRRER